MTEERLKELPDVIIDHRNKKKYNKGKFLGRGGFGRCYEFVDQQDPKVVYAAKVVSKSLLNKPNNKDKMQQEINIHRTLNHRHVLGFHGYFEDDDNMYILLEICRRRSMLELHKRRKYVSEPEVRYYTRQIVNGCQYLHSNKVIHRDLKLANLLLNDEMEVKIADFGLATRLDFEGERKKTLCGTPNYIAPEILNKKGHSFEVDVWSVGCIVYTLLVGNPPFESSNLRDTYNRIRRNEYQIPSRVSRPATKFIRRLLHPDPTQRPSMFSMLDDDFFHLYIPNCLPVSALTTCPRFDTMPDGLQPLARRPLSDVNPYDDHPTSSGGGPMCPAGNTAGSGGAGQGGEEPVDNWLSDLYKQVLRLVERPKEIQATALSAMSEAEDPACAPIYWVSKWVDYSDKYGLGYQLCDNSVGVLFNDVSRLLQTANEQNLQYVEKDGMEHLYTIRQHPEWLDKKVTLLNYFKSYMQENLMKAGENMVPRESDDMARLPFLRTWFRTRSAIILHLSNGTLQVNFFEDHTKIILCPLMSAVTYLDSARDFKTFRFNLLTEHGMTPDLISRLRYAVTMMERMLAYKSNGAAAAPAAGKQTVVPGAAAVGPLAMGKLE